MITLLTTFSVILLDHEHQTLDDTSRTCWWNFPY